ncbi:MAG TPA: hypothetical protein VN132_02865, partial [Bdellovibrio sp.]|nr:hypothetical protein [Bdellovibrio sp.]
MANTFKIFWTDSTSSIQGLVRFRWLALVCLFLGVFPLLQADYLQRNQLPYLIAVLALLSVFNGWSQGVSSKLTRQQEDRWLFVQLTVDLLAAASLLFVTGSANNPFIYVLCIHGFLGGMLLRSTKCFIFIGLIIALLSILQIETYQDARVTVGFDSRELSFHFLTQWILIFAAWFVAFLFSMLMQKQEEHIRRLQEKQWRSDRLKSLGALTAGFSHQLATPLNTLKLRLDRAHRKSSESAIQEELLEAQQALNECITIFHQMAGVFSNSTEGEPQQVKVKTLLQDIVKAWKQDN